MGNESSTLQSGGDLTTPAPTPGATIEPITNASGDVNGDNEGNVEGAVKSTVKSNVKGAVKGAVKRTSPAEDAGGGESTTPPEVVVAPGAKNTTVENTTPEDVAEASVAKTAMVTNATEATEATEAPESTEEEEAKIAECKEILAPAPDIQKIEEAPGFFSWLGNWFSYDYWQETDEEKKKNECEAILEQANTEPETTESPTVNVQSPAAVATVGGRRHTHKNRTSRRKTHKNRE